MVVVATLRARLEDQGRLVCCHAEQWDNSQPRVSLDIREQVRQTFYFGFLSFFVASVQTCQLTSQVTTFNSFKNSLEPVLLTES